MPGAPTSVHWTAKQTSIPDAFFGIVVEPIGARAYDAPFGRTRSNSYYERGTVLEIQSVQQERDVTWMRQMDGLWVKGDFVSQILEEPIDQDFIDGEVRVHRDLPGELKVCQTPLLANSFFSLAPGQKVDVVEQVSFRMPLRCGALTWITCFRIVEKCSGSSGWVEEKFEGLDVFEIVRQTPSETDLSVITLYPCPVIPFPEKSADRKYVMREGLILHMKNRIVKGNYTFYELPSNSGFICSVDSKSRCIAEQAHINAVEQILQIECKSVQVRNAPHIQSEVVKELTQKQEIVSDCTATLLGGGEWLHLQSPCQGWVIAPVSGKDFCLTGRRSTWGSSHVVLSSLSGVPSGHIEGAQPSVRRVMSDGTISIDIFESIRSSPAVRHAFSDATTVCENSKRSVDSRSTMGTFDV